MVVARAGGSLLLGVAPATPAAVAVISASMGSVAKKLPKVDP